MVLNERESDERSVGDVKKKVCNFFLALMLGKSFNQVFNFSLSQLVVVQWRKVGNEIYVQGNGW